MIPEVKELESLLEPTLNALKLIRLDFDAVFLDSGPLEKWPRGKPYLPSVLLRGGWGIHFKQLCCDKDRWRFKPTCPEECECAYRTIFRSEAEGFYDSFTGHEAIPRPYIITTELMEDAKVQGGQQFKFSFILIGSAYQALVPAVGAFFRLADEGIGKHEDNRKNRRRFRILSISQAIGCQKRLFLDSVDDDCLHRIRPVPLKRLIANTPYSHWEKRPLKLTIEFKSPTIFAFDDLGKKASPSRLNANHLAQAAYMRIIRLSEIWCGGNVNHGLLRFEYNAEEQPRKCGSLNISRYSRPRMSRTEKNLQEMRGWIGTVTYEGAINPYHYLLALCNPIGIGQNTSLGFGRYCLILHA